MKKVRRTADRPYQNDLEFFQGNILGLEAPRYENSDIDPRVSETCVWTDGSTHTHTHHTCCSGGACHVHAVIAASCSLL